MAKQTTSISRKSLLMTLCLAFFALLAACDKPQTDKAAESAPPQTATTEETVSGSSSDTTSFETKAAPIVDIAVNADETLLATAQGKKVIVWDLQTGKKKYDLQIEEKDWLADYKHAGDIMTVAFDPKGQWIVIGGVSNYIYFFESASGKYISKIKTPNELTAEICLSADGTLVAAVGTEGFFLFKTFKDILFFENNGDMQVTTNCAFVGDKSITSTTDGYLRLYDNKGNLLIKKLMQDDTIPHDVSVDGNSGLLAVARFKKGTTILSVGDALSLNLQKDVSSKEIKGNFARTIAWKNRENTICSGVHSLNANGKTTIFCWQGGFENPYQIGDFVHHIQSLKMLKNNDAIVVATTASWYLIDFNGNIILQDNIN